MDVGKMIEILDRKRYLAIQCVIYYHSWVNSSASVANDGIGSVSFTYPQRKIAPLQNINAEGSDSHVLALLHHTDMSQNMAQRASQQTQLQPE